jgi:hypothetical protein
MVVTWNQLITVPVAVVVAVAVAVAVVAMAEEVDSIGKVVCTVKK